MPKFQNYVLCVLCCTIADCYSSARTLLLMLAGDVESNPGPLEELMIQFLANQQEVAKDIADNKTDQQSTRAWCASVNNRLTVIETSIEELRSTTKRVEGCEAGLVNVAKTIVDLEQKIDDLEKRSRRNNLILQGRLNRLAPDPVDAPCRVQ